VSGGVCHHVAARYDGYGAAGKGLPQGGEALGTGNIHRKVFREDVDVELVGHGDGRQVAAETVGLGLLAAGELVDGQHHLIPQVQDSLGDALVGEGEGVEGSGEEGDGPGLLKVEAAVEELLLRKEAAHPPQKGAAVVE